MAAPVWQLSVDLQAKTATFTTGLADAAKQARGHFQDIKGGAGEAGGAVSYSMMEARHSVMMLGEEFGIRLPRALAGFIAGLGPIGPALEAAFPFLAIAGLATILIEKIVKLHEEGEKLTEDQLKFQTAVFGAWNTLDDKILQAQIKTDELNKNHLGALRKQLELLDHQSLEELVHSFTEVAKTADVVMKELEGHWYSFGSGSEGAKHALDDFQAHYELLLAQGKEGEASGLLHGTLAQAQHLLGLQSQLKDLGAVDRGSLGMFGYDPAKYQEAVTAFHSLRDMKMGFTESEIAAQQNLVQVLNAQVQSEERIAELKKLSAGNLKTEANQASLKDSNEFGRHRDEENAKAERGFNENFKRFEDERISITEEGSVARLDAIRAAMNDAAALYGEEDVHFQTFADQYVKAYQSLADRTLEAVEKEIEEEAKLKSEAAREAADNAEKMGTLAVARYRQTLALSESAARESAERQTSDSIRAADMEYAIKQAALEKEIQGLDKFDREYQNKLKALQDKEKQLTQQHEDEITAIKEKAEEERNKRILSAESAFYSSVASGLTKSIMGHESWAKTLSSLGDEVVSGMIKNSILILLQQDKERLGDAKTAASNVYATVSAIPVVGPIIAPIAAAGAFSAVMAFERGTDRVPGVGKGDTVPALLAPDEGVVPGGVMDGLRKIASHGGFEAHKAPMVMHVRPVYHINTIDGDGMQGALEKHSDQLQRHIEAGVRRMNR